MRDEPAPAHRLERELRRLGVEGNEAFFAIASACARARGLHVPGLRARGRRALARIDRDPLAAQVLQETTGDGGDQLPVLYQHFVGRTFRQGSGKFFTPAPVARSMASLLDPRPGHLVMDPTSGGGTFLLHASERWGDRPVRLAANDVEPTLAVLTELQLGLHCPGREFEVTEENVFDPGVRLSKHFGAVDAVLANPPFSLRIRAAGFDSPLFGLGYRSSDAIFLDVAHALLRPGGRLVCLLPHSIIANADFARLRAAVEERWRLRAVIGLPEGVFALTAGTSTRAGIVVLDRRPAGADTSVAFAFAPSVGVDLNARGAGRGDALAGIVADRSFRESLDLPAEAAA